MIEKIRTGTKEVMVRHKDHPHIAAFGSTLEIAMGRLRTLHLQHGIQVTL